MKVSLPILSEPAPVVSGKEAGMKTWLLAGRWRIVLAGILVVAAPLIALAAYVYLDLAGHLERLAMERKRDHVEHAVDVIGDKLKTTIAVGSSFASRPWLLAAITDVDREAIRVHLKNLVENYPDIERAYVASPEGVNLMAHPEDLLATGKDFSHMDWYKGVSRSWTPYVSEFYQRFARPQRFLFAIAIPIIDQEKKVMGILVMQAREDFVKSALAGEEGKNHFVYVVDKNGRLIYHPDYYPLERLVDFSHIPAVAKLKNGLQGMEKMEDPISQEKMIVGYRLIKGAGWGVVMQRPEKEVLKPVTQITFGLIIFTGFMLILGGVFAYRGAGLLISSQALTEKLLEEEQSQKAYSELLKLLNNPWTDIGKMGEASLQKFSEHTCVEAGVLYVREDGKLMPIATLAVEKPAGAEGLPSQCLKQQQTLIIHDIPQDTHLQVETGMGELMPKEIVAIPLSFKEEHMGVLELACIHGFKERDLKILGHITPQLALGISILKVQIALRKLSHDLAESNAELQVANEEMQALNEELEERAQLLAQRTDELEHKNREVEQARLGLEEKAEQLALTSKYKSEFLASMSHELRSPLNSMLVLSKMLTDNPEGNLTAKEVQYAATVHSSGSDLLRLINEILDLSKIESGTVRVEAGQVSFASLRDCLDRTFRPVAEGKGLRFTVSLDPSLPPTIHTDEQRLQQVLRNLLSNAFKFTEQGEVAMGFSRATSGWSRDHEFLNGAKAVIAFTVSDTGIGIPPDKQKIIFEAFQQVDNSSARNYGGTGLGLAICRELANLLGGEVRLISSQAGEGSVFTFFLPLGYTPRPTRKPEGRLEGELREETKEKGSPGVTAPAGLLAFDLNRGAPQDQSLFLQVEVSDDRTQIQPGDRTVLIVEDDVHFAPILLDTARERGFKGIVATSAEAGLALARKFKPDAITLDLRLPGMDGLTLLNLLKRDPRTRHLPVHVISVAQEDRQRVLSLGAVAFSPKPVTLESLAATFAGLQDFVARKTKNLLVVEDNEAERQSLVELLQAEDVDITAVGTGAEALTALQSHPFHCLVLDLRLPDLNGLEVMAKIRQDPAFSQLPIVIHTAKDLTEEEEIELRKAAETIIVKNAYSAERLLAEVTLFLHQVEKDLPEPRRRLLQQVQQTAPALAGKKVLVVDDDVRNIFALTSLLENHGMQVLHASKGKDSLEILKKEPGIDLVLMDIMMPEMDGYETMRLIRKIPKSKGLPVIALTAKAMKGDREKCIDAGASDYIPKPVDNEHLLSLLRVWLSR